MPWKDSLKKKKKLTPGCWHTDGRRKAEGNVYVLNKPTVFNINTAPTAEYWRLSKYSQCENVHTTFSAKNLIV